MCPVVPPTPARRSRAFTLIELLTVIAIIGVLTAITIPVVGGVRKTAARANCASNMRQLAMSLVMYAEEHKGMLPLSMNPDPLDPGGPTVSWQMLVQRQMAVAFPQANRDTVFVCTAARETYPVAPYRTYALNLVGGPPESNAPRLASVSSPSRTALVVEVLHNSNGSGHNVVCNNVNGTAGKARLEARHSGKMNMAMTDASVRLVDAGAVEIDDLLLNIRR